MAGPERERATTILRAEHELILHAVGLLERATARVARGDREGDTARREQRALAAAFRARGAPLARATSMAPAPLTRARGSRAR